MDIFTRKRRTIPDKLDWLEKMVHRFWVDMSYPHFVIQERKRGPLVGDGSFLFLRPEHSALLKQLSEDREYVNMKE